MMSLAVCIYKVPILCSFQLIEKPTISVYLICVLVQYTHTSTWQRYKAVEVGFPRCGVGFKSP